ncbi:MAG: hypothetical protein EPN20_12520 [Magnetospirillum sp.]|nr:MAG: hypothetical protein EPN20_12520 [Magnetospirillum sp.]
MSDIVIKIRGEAAGLKASMDESANAVRDGAARMLSSMGEFASGASDRADRVAGRLDSVAEASALAAAGFAALGQVHVSAPLIDVAAGAETAAVSLRTLGYGADAMAGLLARATPAVRDQADAARDMAAANQEAGSSWGWWAAGAAAVGLLAAGIYAQYQAMSLLKEGVEAASNAIADWAGRYPWRRWLPC